MRRYKQERQATGRERIDPSQPASIADADRGSIPAHHSAEEFEMSKSQAHPQTAGSQAALARDAGTLSDKFAGLALAMSGKYDWRPAQGVRSVAEVFSLIIKENGLLVGVLSGKPDTGAPPALITDPDQMHEALKASYVRLQETIAGLSDEDLKTTVKLFGRDWEKQDAVRYILQDQHEHLGQSIAYARSNGVVPPWSK